MDSPTTYTRLRCTTRTFCAPGTCERCVGVDSTPRTHAGPRPVRRTKKSTRERGCQPQTQGVRAADGGTGVQAAARQAAQAAGRQAGAGRAPPGLSCSSRTAAPTSAAPAAPSSASSPPPACAAARPVRALPRTSPASGAPHGLPAAPARRRQQERRSAAATHTVRGALARSKISLQVLRAPHGARRRLAAGATPGRSRRKGAHLVTLRWCIASKSYMVRQFGHRAAAPSLAASPQMRCQHHRHMA